MKRKLFFIALISTLIVGNLFIVIKVYSLQDVINEKNEEIIKAKKEYPEIYNYLDSITVDSFESRIYNKESFYIYLGRPTCGDCNNFEPKLIELIKKFEVKNELLYLNVAELRKHENKWEVFKKMYNLKYTPTIAKFVRGELESKVEWTPESGISINEVNQWIVRNMD